MTLLRQRINQHFSVGTKAPYQNSA